MRIIRASIKNPYEIRAFYALLTSCPFYGVDILFGYLHNNVFRSHMMVIQCPNRTHRRRGWRIILFTAS